MFLIFQLQRMQKQMARREAEICQRLNNQLEKSDEILRQREDALQVRRRTFYFVILLLKMMVKRNNNSNEKREREKKQQQQQQGTLHSNIDCIPRAPLVPVAGKGGRGDGAYIWRDGMGPHLTERQIACKRITFTMHTTHLRSKYSHG